MSYAFVENKSQFGPDEQAGNDTSFSPTTYPRLQIAGSNAAGQVILAPPNFTVYGFAGVAYLDSPTRTYNGFFNDTGIISVRGYTPVAVTSSLVLSAAATSSGGNTVYTGTIINGGSNAYAGMYFTTTGFSNSGNNVSFVQCVASSATTLTLINAGGVAESHVATASVANNWIISGMEVGFEVEP